MNDDREFLVSTPHFEPRHVWAPDPETAARREAARAHEYFDWFKWGAKTFTVEDVVTGESKRFQADVEISLTLEREP